MSKLSMVNVTQLIAQMSEVCPRPHWKLCSNGLKNTAREKLIPKMIIMMIKPAPTTTQP